MAITAQPAIGASTGRGTYAPPDPHVIRIRDLIYTEAGIFYPDNKLQILEERCVTRMKEAGAGNIAAYYRLLTSGPTRRDELVDLLNKITVGETCFFRNQAQLEALRKIMLPKIVEARLKTGMPGIRIWSAGCSTGEEPYTLAMILSEEKQGALKGFNFEVHATDLNEISLEQAQRVSTEITVPGTSPHTSGKSTSRNRTACCNSSRHCRLLSASIESTCRTMNAWP